jgi:hypothetical protein
VYTSQPQRGTNTTRAIHFARVEPLIGIILKKQVVRRRRDRHDDRVTNLSYDAKK